MRKRTVGMYVLAALVAGVVLGSFGIATAAPSSNPSGTAGAGLRLGASVAAAKATLADVVAKLTGQTVAEVRTERASGKSLAQIASDSGVSSTKVVSDAITARKAMLANLVKQGKITQAQADAALARMTARINARVNSTAPCNGTGPGSGACTGAGGGCGMGGAGTRGGSGACGGCTTATQ